MNAKLKALLKKLPLRITKNQRYDSQTEKIISKYCIDNSITVDVGCHKGEILDIFLKNAPNGIHYGFEPIPDLFTALKQKYNDCTRCVISDLALSDTKGVSTFNYVTTNPAYSGLKKREYDIHEKETIISVNTDLLDNFPFMDNRLPDLIKIDVEGGELQVLRGSINLIKDSKPIIIFEHGLGASEYYGTTPNEVFDLLNDSGLLVSTMHRFLRKKTPFNKTDFCYQYYSRKNYYFVAYPPGKL